MTSHPTTGAKHIILEGTTQWSSPHTARDVMKDTLSWARELVAQLPA